MLCVPLRVEGRVIGALEVLNKPSGFTEGDAELLGLLAHFAATAVESKRLRQEAVKARMMDHELTLAMDVQQHLLPQEQECVQGLECVGFCRPARSVGGDYYDMLPLPGGGFAFTLDDVSGKGVPAAVMMASIQTLLHNLLQREPVGGCCGQRFEPHALRLFGAGSLLDPVLWFDPTRPQVDHLR